VCSFVGIPVGFKVFWGCVSLVEYCHLLDKVWSPGFARDYGNNDVEDVDS